MPSDSDNSVFARLGRRALVGRLRGQLDELLAARDQMEQLLQVIIEIGSDLDLTATLHRVVVAAMELTGARYGALGVRNSDGTLNSFIHAGMDAETIRRIGHLPVGKGVLDISRAKAHPLRLDDLTVHPAAVGFPEHHPPMYALLSVPITIRRLVFGNLYLTHGEPSRIFTETDEAAACALASAAAVAIDNAQLFEHEQVSAKWTEASRQITTALLSDTEVLPDPLQLIAERVRELTDSEQAIVLVPSDPELPVDEVEALVVSTAVGLHAAEVTNQRVPVESSTSGSVFRSGTALLTESFSHPIQAFTDVGQRPAIVVPLCAEGGVLGVLAVARNTGQPPFDECCLDLVTDFARHAAIALMLAASRERSRELDILADRERIAHDLHDHVIQRLFIAGLDLQGTMARVHSPEVITRLDHTVNDLQDVITEIRTAIFKLTSPPSADGGFGSRIQRIIQELTRYLNIATTVTIDGPMAIVDGELAEHAEAITTEAISNALRHSGASRITVDVRAADTLTIDISDNGRGIPADNQRRSGLANMQYRAVQLGGTCEIIAPPGGGTRVHWAVPLNVPNGWG